MIKIGFFFQSMVLNFSSEDLGEKDTQKAGEAAIQISETQSQPLPPVFLRSPGGFVLLTRDKAMTSSVLAQFADAVNMARQKCRPPITEEISTLNMDDSILNELALASISGQVCVFQPLHQRLAFTYILPFVTIRFLYVLIYLYISPFFILLY
jgi:hypothetical protein